MEYVIEAADVDDMKSWLATIKYCMRSAPTSQPPPEALAGLPEPAPPDLPPRRDLPTSNSNVDLATDTPDDGELGKLYSIITIREPMRGSSGLIQEQQIKIWDSCCTTLRISTQSELSI